LAEAFAQRTQAEWTVVFEGSDACVAPVMAMDDAPDHPHLAARGTYVEHHGRTQPAPAPRFSRTPGQLGDPPVRPGTHTRDVLAECGVRGIDGVLSRGVVAQSDTAEGAAANPE